MSTLLFQTHHNNVKIKALLMSFFLQDQNQKGASYFEERNPNLTCKYQPPQHDYIRKVRVSVGPVVSVFPFVVSLVPLKKPRKLLLNQCTLPENYEI